MDVGVRFVCGDISETKARPIGTFLSAEKPRCVGIEYSSFKEAIYRKRIKPFGRSHLSMFSESGI